MKKIILAALAAMSLAACTEVPVGHKGVVVSQGSFEGVESEGLVWHGPLTDVIPIDMRQIKWESETSAYTKDVQQAGIKFALTYRLEPTAVKTVYRTVGEDWAVKLIPQVVEESVKAALGQAEAVKDVINNRTSVQQRILADLRVKLRAKNVIVEGFEIKDVRFSEAFENAVEAKQVAVENANAEKNKTVAVQERANQAVIEAKAEAEAMRIKTAALAGSHKLVEYEAAQKWDGALPQYMTGGGVPFIQLPGRK